MSSKARNRARCVKNQIESMATPFNFTEWLAGDSTRHEIHALLGIAVVSTCAKAAAGLMLSCTTWSDALRPLMLLKMKEINKEFAAAQMADFELKQLGDVTRYKAIEMIMKEPSYHFEPSFDEMEQNADHPLVNEKLRLLQEDVRAKRDIVRSFELSAGCFDSDMAKNALKTAYSGSRPVRKALLGEDTVHAYTAMGLRLCEVCGPLGIACNAVCTSTFYYAPFDEDDQMRVLRCGSDCIAKQCFAFNPYSTHPLALSSLGRSDQNARHIPYFYRTENNKLLTNALRYVNISCPATLDVLVTRLGKEDEYILRKRNEAGPRTDNYNLVAGLRHFWLKKHPTLPANYSMQHKLAIPDVAFERGEEDMKRAEARDDAIAEMSVKYRNDKLIADVNALFKTRVSLSALGMTTIEEVDKFYPGAAATLKVILMNDRYAHVEHALDLPFTRLFVDTVATTIVDIRKWDNGVSPRNRAASGFAVGWLTGLSVGSTPGVSLQDVSRKLYSINGLTPEAMCFDYESIITTAYLFDAIQWNKLNVIKTRGVAHGMPGCSSDPLPTHWTRPASCYINVGMGMQVLSIYFEVEYKRTRSEWLELRLSAERLLEKTCLELEAPLPTVPSEEQIDELFEEGKAATIATDWLTFMAQTLAYYPSTRGMGLDILTNFSTHSVVMAVQHSVANIDMLDAIIAVKEADYDPME